MLAHAYPQKSPEHQSSLWDLPPLRKTQVAQLVIPVSWSTRLDKRWFGQRAACQPASKLAMMLMIIGRSVSTIMVGRPLCFFLSLGVWGFDSKNFFSTFESLNLGFGASIQRTSFQPLNLWIFEFGVWKLQKLQFFSVCNLPKYPNYLTT